MDRWISAVFKVRIYGRIGHNTLKKLNRDLSKNQSHKPLALAVCVNSPGGSPAYSSLVRQRILAFSRKHDVPVFAFAEDMAASGGYYVLTAGSELYACHNSLLGSIGARFDFYGMKKTFAGWGIERRNWGGLAPIEQRIDPLRDIEPGSQKWMQQMVDETREEFARVVEASREGKLKAPKEELFNGDVFSGATAVQNGLIDKLGICDEIMNEIYPSYKIKDISKESKLEKLREKIESLQDYQ